VPTEAPLDTVCYLGCGGITGLGTVLNALKPAVGSTLAVFGGGSVGLCSVMAAKLASVGQIITVDIVDNRLKLARELGATHTINATQENPVEIIGQLTDEGADYAVVALSSIEVLTQAVKSLRPGGKCVTLGGVPHGTTANVDLLSRMTERSIRGGNMGSGQPSLEIPAYVNLFLAGRLPLDKLISRKFTLAEINEAFAASSSGEVIKPVIQF
jgi:aryl-alcohol dehydrogenase